MGKGKGGGGEAEEDQEQQKQGGNTLGKCVYATVIVLSKLHRPEKATEKKRQQQQSCTRPRAKPMSELHCCLKFNRFYCATRPASA